ncbi:MAG TPA: fatty acid desaturase [Casimicrobiaceae bacterium]|nr:fatty acid desaturase [Casimicrobiaceae bacterium]
MANEVAYGIQPGEAPWFSTLRVLERHVGALFAIAFVPLTGPLLALAAASFAIRMFAIEGINHRYFSHRAYKASRPVQFVLALLASQTGQRGSLWWASKHREHHKHAETQLDPHSPATHSFFESYVAWFRRPHHAATDLDAIADFAKYPELRFLDRYYWLPFYAGSLVLFLACHYGLLGAAIGGITGILWGFYVPCCLVLHATSMINTFAHMPQIPGGYRRYDIQDHSVNRPALALFTLGGGFHNNHHRYGAAARAGFAWYELDISYGVLRAMEALRLIRDVKSTIPEEILIEGGLRPRGKPA